MNVNTVENNKNNAYGPLPGFDFDNDSSAWKIMQKIFFSLKIRVTRYFKQKTPFAFG